MATKPAAKAAPAKKSASTAIVPWQEEMRAAAQRGAKAEKPVGGFASIGIGGGILKVDDVPVPGNKMSVVILAATPEYQYYSTAYDPGNPTSPDCYAFGDPQAESPEDGMAPHEEATNKQGDDNGLCSACWANQMGSADVGRGKACKNIRRMLLTTEDALEDPAALASAEMRMLKVPVMSVKNWVNYVKQDLAEMERPAWGVVTEISVVPDPKSQFRVVFAFQELINFDQALYDAMKKKVKAAESQLITPYPPLEEAPPRRTAAPGRAVKTPVRPAAPARGPAAKTPAAPAKKAKY